MRENNSRKPAGKFRRDSGKFSDRRSGGFRRDSGRSDRFQKRDSSGRGRNKLEMHKITCDKCGKESEVPFKPTSSKPIYCSDCFKKKEGGSGKSGVSAEDIAMLNMKLDKIMYALKIR